MSDASSISEANAHHSEIHHEQNSSRFWDGTEQPIAPFLRLRKTTVKTLPNVSANDIRPDARHAAPRHNGAPHINTVGSIVS